MKHHKYLYRLAAIFLALLFVPIVIISTVSWHRSYQEIEHSNEIYYNKLTESFVTMMFEELKQLERHATSVCVKSKNTGSAFYGGDKKFSSSAYWFYEAVNELRTQHSGYSAADCGIYYYGSGRVITKNHCQTLDQYIRNTLELNDTGLAFFASENYQLSTALFGTTATPANPNGDLLVGYCVTMGRNADKVLIFYRVTMQYSDRLKALVSQNSGIEFYVSDRESDTTLLALREEQNGMATSHDVKNVYRSDDSTFPLTFTIHVMADSLRNNVMTFYQTMQLLWFATTAILLVVALIALYLAYRPINLLVKELDTGLGSGGEIEAIRHALSTKDSKIQEQRSQMVSLLVEHLIHGGHISRKHLLELGVDVSSAPYYCVLLVEQGTFLDGETEQLAKAAEQNFQIRLFITETEDELKSVAVAFLRENNCDAIGIWIQRWLREHFATDYCVKTGEVVDKLDDIRASFVSCYKQNDGLADLNIVKKDLQALEYKECRKKQQQEQVLAYLEKHYCDADLSQPQVAEFLNISTYTLSRLFKNQVGIGFTEYINAKRINRAKELLLTTSDSTRDIAEQVGLPNYNYFLRLFKSVVGVTPTAFRDKR